MRVTEIPNIKNSAFTSNKKLKMCLLKYEQKISFIYTQKYQCLLI